jgi:hypothetical protein
MWPRRARAPRAAARSQGMPASSAGRGLAAALVQGSSGHRQGMRVKSYQDYPANCRRKDIAASKLPSDRVTPTHRPVPEDSMETTSRGCCCSTRAAPGRRGHAREGIRHLADADLGRRSRDGGAPRLRPAPGRPAARRAHGGDRRQPAAPVRHDAGAQALGAIPVPLYQDAASAECVFPINNAEVRFAIVEDQEQVDKLLEMRRSARSCRPSGSTTRAACATTASRACLAGRADRQRARVRAGAPGFFQREVDAGQPDDVAAMFFTSGTTGNPRAWCTRTARCSTAPGRRRVRQADRARGSAGLHAAGLGRARTSSATRSGWPAATWSTAPSRRAP